MGPVSYTHLDVYKRQGGTYGALFIPWNTNALFCAGALGVSVLSFIPYIPLLYITPVVVIIYSITKLDVYKRQRLPGVHTGCRTLDFPGNLVYY